MADLDLPVLMGIIAVEAIFTRRAFNNLSLYTASRSGDDLAGILINVLYLSIFVVGYTYVKGLFFFVWQMFWIVLMLVVFYRFRSWIDSALASPRKMYIMMGIFLFWFGCAVVGTDVGRMNIPEIPKGFIPLVIGIALIMAGLDPRTKK
jgi:hypothetical protein